MEKETHKRIRKTAVILSWLVIWQVAAVWADNRILLVGPLQVLEALAENVMRPDFLAVIGCSFARIGLGFFLALFAGLLFGAVSYRFPFAGEVLSPVMAVLKSVPVASFVVLLLIWFGSGRLSFLISFLIVFPNVYVNTVAGLRSTDIKLLEMARVFGIGGWKKFLYIYRPALMPYLNGCLRISLGMSWKSGVAAEIIGLPEHSLGERLYMSKIYLDTAGLFAWTLTIVLASFLFEKAVLGLLKVFAGWKPYPAPGFAGKRKERDDEAEGKPGRAEREAIRIMQIEKAYDGRPVLCGFNMAMRAGGRYFLTAPSGAGKTTLLRIVTGLEKADGGTVTGMPARIGMVFQEDRLCEEYDAVCNIMLGMDREACRGKGRGELVEYVRAQAAEILPEDCLEKPVRKLSGGMRRRTALLRAVLSGADVLVLDEPFTGLDEENRIRSAAYLAGHLCGRTLLATAHGAEDAKLLKGTEILL